VASPDEWLAHRPRGHCECGVGLASAADVGIERSVQEHDLPEIRVRVRQHDVDRVRCGCGREHAGSLPGGVSPAPSSYGAHLKVSMLFSRWVLHMGCLPPGRLRPRRRRDGIPAQLVTHHFHAVVPGHPEAARRRRQFLVVSLDISLPCLVIWLPCR
jgi:hypothetical protein